MGLAIPRSQLMKQKRLAGQCPLLTVNIENHPSRQKVLLRRTHEIGHIILQSLQRRARLVPPPKVRTVANPPSRPVDRMHCQ